MSKCIMSSKDFRKLTKRDFDNGAVKAEIWNGLHDREQLQAKLDAHRWIPVEERLPEAGKDVMVVNNNAYRRDVWVTRWANVWMDTVFKPHPSHITHWKPIILPEGE